MPSSCNVPRRDLRDGTRPGRRQHRPHRGRDRWIRHRRACPRLGVGRGRLHQATVDVVHAWTMPYGIGRADGCPARTTPPRWRPRPAARSMPPSSPPTPAGVPAVTRTVAIGSPAAAILDVAQGADLVVVGSRGLGGFRGLVLGSTSHQLAHHATCAVVILPATQARPRARHDHHFRRSYSLVYGVTMSMEGLAFGVASGLIFGDAVLDVPGRSNATVPSALERAAWDALSMVARSGAPCRHRLAWPRLRRAHRRRSPVRRDDPEDARMAPLRGARGRGRPCGGGTRLTRTPRGGCAHRGQSALDAEPALDQRERPAGLSTMMATVGWPADGRRVPASSGGRS